MSAPTVFDDHGYHDHIESADRSIASGIWGHCDKCGMRGDHPIHNRRPENHSIGQTFSTILPHAFRYTGDSDFPEEYLCEVCNLPDKNVIHNQPFRVHTKILKPASKLDKILERITVLESDAIEMKRRIAQLEKELTE